MIHETHFAKIIADPTDTAGVRNTEKPALPAQGGAPESETRTESRFEMTFKEAAGDLWKDIEGFGSQLKAGFWGESLDGPVTAQGPESVAPGRSEGGQAGRSSKGDVQITAAGMIAVSNPVRIIVNQAPAAVTAGEEAVEQAPVIVRNPVRIIMDRGPTFVSNPVQIITNTGPAPIAVVEEAAETVVVSNPVQIITNTGPATVVAVEEAAVEVLRENGVNGRNALVGTGIGVGGAGTAGVAMQAAELGAAVAVGVGLGAAIVYSGAGEVLPVLPFITYKQAGNWMGETAYQLSHPQEN